MLRLAFVSAFALTGLLTLTVVGHAQGIMDWVAFLCSVVGFVLTVTLEPQYERADFSHRLVLRNRRPCSVEYCGVCFHGAAEASVHVQIRTDRIRGGMLVVDGPPVARPWICVSNDKSLEARTRRRPPRPRVVPAAFLSARSFRYDAGHEGDKPATLGRMHDGLNLQRPLILSVSLLFVAGISGGAINS
jgi:hypothetical protein